MPRSSRHKSSKHSSREGRDYSDSEKDTSLKERKSKEESASHRGSREYASGDKRKYDSKPVDGKDVGGGLNADFVEEYGGSSSKKRKDKVDDDRWTGGDTDERESLKADKDLKGLSDSKSRSRRGNETSGRAVDVDEGKKSGGKGDSKHHRSERKERSEKEGGFERDRKGKEYNSTEKFVDGELIDIVGDGSRKKVAPLDDGAEKHISGNSGIVSLEERRNPDHDRELERRFRKKDSSNDVDKYLDGKEVDDKRLSSKNETAKSGKYKDDGHEDDRYKDKYGEDIERDSRFQDEKQHHRDGRHARDYVSSRSDEKYLRNDKKDLDVQHKKSKPQDNDRDHARSRHSRHHDERDRDDRNRDVDLDKDGDHDGGRDLDRDRGRDLDHDRGRDRDRGRELDRDRDRDRERYRREHDRDYSSHVDERSARYKDDRNRRRSPDDYDDYYNDKAKSVKTDPHTDREKSVSRRTHSEAVAGSTRGRTSPSYKSHMNVDKYRDSTHDDSRYGDSRQLQATPDKSSKYPSSDKNPKVDDSNRVRDRSAEKSPKKKTSPFKLVEKSPSSTSIDRKYVNKSDRRRSLDVDEAERRSSGSNNVRDGSINEDRQSKDLSPKKSLGEEHSPVESSFHRKPSQGNGSFLGHGSSSYKAGADSPSLIGPMGEDSRGHNNRYRRSVDPNMGRAHGNIWKGVPNWPTPLQSGFMPFPPGPHGPPHGVFPSVLPQFPNPPIFGVRPPMEMNHSGIPYHLPDADRFTNHMRPLGWQNMVDGSTPSHFPAWDANNGMFRDEPSIYGPGGIPNGRVRETNADMWKPNGDVKLESGSQKDGNMTEDVTDEALVTQGGAQGSHTDNFQNEEQGAMKIPNGTPINEALITTSIVADEKVPESPAVDDGPKSLRAYLSCLDISVELTKPELYNEFVSLAVIEQSDNFEEMEDVNTGMQKVVDSETISVTTDISLFPAAEDSIFQRAMDLYKIHNNNMDRKSFHIFDDVSKLPASAEMNVMEQGQGQEEAVEKEMDERVHYEEILGQAVEELCSAAVDTEQMGTETLPTSGSGAVIDSPDSDVAVKEMVSVENMSLNLTSGDVLNSNTDDDAGTRVGEDENAGNNEPAPCVVEQLGIEVSSPLNLGHGSVKVCEGLMPVSNEYESESVTITRVNDAPESTH